MNIVRSFAIFTLITSTVSGDRIRSPRQLSFELIAGYEPLTSVTDHVSNVETIVFERGVCNGPSTNVSLTPSECNCV